MLESLGSDFEDTPLALFSILGEVREIVGRAMRLDVCRHFSRIPDAWLGERQLEGPLFAKLVGHGEVRARGASLRQLCVAQDRSYVKTGSNH